MDKLIEATYHTGLLLGMTPEQIEAEIEAIVAEAVQPRTCPIATALGITNTDILKLKEEGE